MNTIDSIIKKIELLFAGDFSGHDFQHSIRVYRNACLISGSEECDKDVVSLAALLHDADDVKLFHTENYANAKEIMTEEDIDAEIQAQVIDVISTVSFKGT